MNCLFSHLSIDLNVNQHHHIINPSDFDHTYPILLREAMPKCPTLVPGTTFTGFFSAVATFSVWGGCLTLAWLAWTWHVEQLRHSPIPLRFSWNHVLNKNTRITRMHYTALHLYVTCVKPRKHIQSHPNSPLFHTLQHSLVPSPSNLPPPPPPASSSPPAPAPPARQLAALSAPVAPAAVRAQPGVGRVPSPRWRWPQRHTKQGAWEWEPSFLAESSMMSLVFWQMILLHVQGFVATFGGTKHGQDYFQMCEKPSQLRLIKILGTWPSAHRPLGPPACSWRACSARTWATKTLLGHSSKPNGTAKTRPGCLFPAPVAATSACNCFGASSWPKFDAWSGSVFRRLKGRMWSCLAFLPYWQKVISTPNSGLCSRMLRLHPGLISREKQASPTHLCCTSHPKAPSLLTSLLTLYAYLYVSPSKSQWIRPPPTNQNHNRLCFQGNGPQGLTETIGGNSWLGPMARPHQKCMAILWMCLIVFLMGLL